MERFSTEIECFQSPSEPIEYDAFRCRFPGCNARYQRKEHLNRHERSKHVKQQGLICSRCGAEFRRSDTLRRHIRTLHKIKEPPKRAPKACVSCHTGKTRCEGGVPCDECVRRSVRCSFQSHASNAAEQKAPLSIQSPPLPTLERPGSYHCENRQQWIDLYFEVFHPRWPFLHRGTFDVRQEPQLLLQSMMAIGMWISGEKAAQSAAVELFGKLDLAIRGQMDKWDASEAEEACSECAWPIATYQALLLHFILAVVIKADNVVNLDLKASISAPDLELLKSLVGSCRRLGIEEVKRFGVALYRLCARLSHSSTDDGPLLNASELQFPMPSNDALWNSVDRDEWEANVRNTTISLKEDLQERWISSHKDTIDLL